MNQTKHNMNLALDRLLSDVEQDNLNAHVEAAPGDAIFWDRLQAVDGMLRNAPTLEAPPDFCDRLMIALAARSELSPAQRPSLGPVLGLALAVIITAPLALISARLLEHWLADPTAINSFFNTVWQPILYFLNTIVQIGATALALFIPITLAGMGLLWLTSPRRGETTYRIPVTAA